jgi:cyclopropane fatty-acyl-phospholipid synthase-like methyltransferase
MAHVPERLTRAVEALDVQPEDRILEIGCGRGVAAALICSRLRGGHLVALDRSATAVAAARQRAADYVSAGTAELITGALEDVDPARLGSFDKVLAVNVNLFWVRPARAELGLVTELLRPHGRLHLVYEPPGPDRLAHLRQRLLAHLEQAGFTTETVSQPNLLSVTARVP